MSLRLCLLLCSLPCVLARFSYSKCCSNANLTQSLFTQNNQTDIFSPFSGDYTTCNQDFNATIPPSVDVYVSYYHCKSNCSGFELSKGDEPAAWAAPVVQFILPSLIFSMSIPRRRMFIPSWKAQEGLNLTSLLLFGPVSMLLTAVDTLIWVAIILTLAGPMMVAGLTEALLDFRILNSLSLHKHRPGEVFYLNDQSRLRLLVAIVCGNLELRETDHNSYDLLSGRLYTSVHQGMTSPDPLTEIPNALEEVPQITNRKYKMLNLLSAQGDFGALVGAPVAFYLGGFVYTILDLLDDPSVQDAAISLAYGVEWMIVVHVSIIAGCLLASNNPSAVSVLGQLSAQPSRPGSNWSSLVYETRYQPVSMQSRGRNKKAWLRNLPGSSTDQKKALEAVRVDVRIGLWGYLLWVALPTFILISLPPAAGAVVAWQTPPVGLGCRSLTLILYASCQSFLTVFYEIEHWLRPSGTMSRWNAVAKTDRMEWIWQLTGRTLYLAFIAVPYATFCFLALFTALGGTIMQVMGVYKNCFCYVNAPLWLSLDTAYVGIASDTLDQRNSSHNWLVMGCVATAFMALCSYIGWWYQRMIRTEYKSQVDKL